ncbi:ATP-binding protein [Halorutilales archaeon Cl-col2-1]
MEDDILEDEPWGSDSDSNPNPNSDTDVPTGSSTIPEGDYPSPKTESPSDSEATVGHILASERIIVGDTENKINIYVDIDRRDEIRLGDYVQIPYSVGDGSEKYLFAVVSSLRYEPYTQVNDKSQSYAEVSLGDEVDEREFVLVAETKPLSIVESEGDGDGYGRKPVDQIPKPNTPSSLARDEDVLRTGLNVPGDGIFAGYMAVGGRRIEVDGEPLAYYLENPGIDPSGEVEEGEPAVFRHMLVAGSTGKGKTHFTKNILRQLSSEKRYPIDEYGSGETLRMRLNTVVIDPEGEYVEMSEDNPELPEDDERRLRRRGVKTGGIDDLEVFVPTVAGAPAPSAPSYREFTVPFGIVDDVPELLMPFDPSPVTRRAISDCLNAYFSTADDPTYEGFTDYMETNDSSEVNAVKEANSIADATWDAVMRRVVDNGVYHRVFDNGTDPLTEITDDVFDEGQTTVIPTSHIRGAVEDLVVLSLLALVIENKISEHDVDDEIKNTPIFVATDEAHNYFAEADTTRGRYVVEKARAAVKQGRKDLLGLGMITQNPEDIDDEILKQINTNIFMGLRDEVVERVPSIPSQFRSEIPTFGKGEAVVKAPDVEAVEVEGLRYCVTKHGN